MPFFTHDFYVLNAAQQFSFPHMNCDEYSCEELTAWFYKPDYFCFYILKYYKHDATASDIESIKSPLLSTFGSSWMRLKFAAEVLDPVYVSRCLESKLCNKPFFAPYAIWKTEATSRGSLVDNLANYLLYRIINIIESCVRKTEPFQYTNDSDIISALQKMNAAIYTIRKIPYDGVFPWSGTHPCEFPLCSYFAFITQMWDAIEPLTRLPMYEEP